MTSPSPFKLSEPKAKPSIQEYKSMAQAIKEFQSKTPARFHTRKAQDRRRSRSSDATVSSFNRAVRAIREVCSPKLLTKLRQRPVTCLSREQEEELELENIRK